MEYYTKLFNFNWVQPWMVEAMITIVGALILAFVVCKATDCLNGNDQMFLKVNKNHEQDNK